MAKTFPQNIPLLPSNLQLRDLISMNPCDSDSPCYFVEFFSPSTTVCYKFSQLKYTLFNMPLFTSGPTFFAVPVPLLNRLFLLDLFMPLKIVPSLLYLLLVISFQTFFFLFPVILEKSLYVCFKEQYIPLLQTSLLRMLVTSNICCY